MSTPATRVSVREVGLRGGLQSISRVVPTALIEVGISAAFGCTIQGRVDPEEVLRL
jgi:hypothetical protein